MSQFLFDLNSLTIDNFGLKFNNFKSSINMFKTPILRAFIDDYTEVIYPEYNISMTAYEITHDGMYKIRTESSLITVSEIETTYQQITDDKLFGPVRVMFDDMRFTRFIPKLHIRYAVRIFEKNNNIVVIQDNYKKIFKINNTMSIIGVYYSDDYLMIYTNDFMCHIYDLADGKINCAYLCYQVTRSFFTSTVGLDFTTILPQDVPMELVIYNYFDKQYKRYDMVNAQQHIDNPLFIFMNRNKDKKIIFNPTYNGDQVLKLKRYWWIGITAYMSTTIARIRLEFWF